MKLAFNTQMMILSFPKFQISSTVLKMKMNKLILLKSSAHTMVNTLHSILLLQILIALQMLSRLTNLPGLFAGRVRRKGQRQKIKLLYPNRTTISSCHWSVYLNYLKNCIIFLNLVALRLSPRDFLRARQMRHHNLWQQEPFSSWLYWWVSPSFPKSPILPISALWEWVYSSFRYCTWSKQVVLSICVHKYSVSTHWPVYVVKELHAI